MNTTVRILAPAKLNLHLDVFPLRNDGFHGLRSLFVIVPLYDTILIEPKSDEKFKIEGFEGIPMEQNLIWKAYSAYCSRLGEDIPIQVRVQKEIPVMAGLGGGSSDAAAMLKALQFIRRREGKGTLERKEMASIALGLGSDVPFFLGSAAAYAEGRGEKLSALEARDDLYAVIVKPEFDVSTGDAFRMLDERGAVSPLHLSKAEIIARYRTKKPAEWEYYNSFTTVLCEKYPNLSRLISELKASGAEYSNLSGSGSALFGIYTDAKQAEKAFFRLKKFVKKAWKVKMLAYPPEAVYN